MILAIQFLTILPIITKNIPGRKDFSRAIVFFPAVGLIIGIILAGSNFVLSSILPNRIVSIIVVILLIVMTGGLHCDGLADTFDGLSGGKNRQERLEIMRDSRIGAMGVLSLVCVFVLKVSLIEAIPVSAKSVCLMAMPVFGRWSMLLPMKFFPYARMEGKAKIFFESINAKVLLTATVIMLLLVLALLNTGGAYILLVVTPITILFSLFANKRLGGITGDVLGAVNEISEILFLFSLFLMEI